LSKILTIMLPVMVLISVFPDGAWAFATGPERLDLTTHTVGITALILFVVAYGFVMAEEFTHLRKSKPVLLAAGIIWAMIAVVYVNHDMPHAAEEAIRHNILEYSELFLFLLVAMTYINSMDERLVFDSLRAWLVRSGFSYRTLFWLTGGLAFFISPVADNLTTALLMCAVVLAVGRDNARFVSLSCINIVVGANAGGAFSPFGDITTLMVWQKGIVGFWTFFLLFVPSVVNWIVPAAIMHLAVPDEQPVATGEVVVMKRGAKRVIFLFLCTIVTAVSFHQFLHLPPMVGMMTGLAYLKIFGYYLKKTFDAQAAYERRKTAFNELQMGDIVPFDIFRNIARAEWDTLMFFYGVILCVGGLGFIGYLALTSEVMYTQWGAVFGLSQDWAATPANIMVGVLSAIVDNIPVMFAVLTMQPDMPMGQWLLVTFTAGVGGSILSIGSAAGVALMGQARGMYTFFSHLRWTPAIALGYAVGILVHIWVNSTQFALPPAQ
jgi:NhaD family Na+/H+ antiporter